MGGTGPEERLQALAAKQHGVVTRQQVLAEGGTANLIKKRVRHGTWKRVLAEVYQIDLSADEHLGRIHGAVLRTNGVAIRRTAARLFGMDAFDTCDVIEVASDADLRFEGVRVFRGAAIPRWALTRRDGILTTQPIWTVLDLCRVATLEQVECAIDFCIRMKWTSFPELQKAADHYGARGRPGLSVLRRILELRAPQWLHTDSILETMCLQLLRAAHLPKPVLQYAIVHNGREIAHADLAFPERRVLIETLGLKAHREKRWQLTRDCVRENAIELLRGYTVLKFTSDQVRYQPEVVMGDVCQALGIPVQKQLRLMSRGRPA